MPSLNIDTSNWSWIAFVNCSRPWLVIAACILGVVPWTGLQTIRARTRTTHENKRTRPPANAHMPIRTRTHARARELVQVQRAAC